MRPDRLELAPGLWADARRAAWLEPEHTLAVADLHLGYAWAQRQRGALLPLAEVEQAAARLRELVADYRPGTLVFLGDLVHAPLLAEPASASVRELIEALAHTCRLVLTLGNHDRGMPEFAVRNGLPLRCESAWRAGPHLLLHGDATAGKRRAGRGGFMVMGHEHPMVVLDGGVAARARCPCFLEGERRLMLPAFSRWAGGAVVGRALFMSGLARTTRWRVATVIVGARLLRVPWPP